MVANKLQQLTQKLLQQVIKLISPVLKLPAVTLNSLSIPPTKAAVRLINLLAVLNKLQNSLIKA
jgi:hypothetical protein